jgi:FkbM family methyltransferase
MQTSRLPYNVIHFRDFDSAHVPEILQEIYLQQIYFPFLSSKKDLTIFDCGLNIGLFSLYASKYAKQIYAFEPAATIYQIAQKNLTENGITNVKTFQKAISSEDGKTNFYHSSNETAYSLNPAINDNKEKEEVETIRLDTFVKQENIEHIDFLKMDVEGEEAKIFTSESFKNIVPIIDCMVYEWHSWGQSNPNVINHGLIGLGFRTIKQLAAQATVFACIK